jgi:tRNA modification GTPase
VEVGGVPVRLMDTAGIREEAGAIEASGIEMARRWLEAADLIVWLHRYAWGPPGDEDRQWMDELHGVAEGDVKVIPVASCTDEGSAPSALSGGGVGAWPVVGEEPWIPLSVDSGVGFAELKFRIGTVLLGVSDGVGAMDEGSILVRKEEASAATEALEAVTEAARLLDAGYGAELAAVEVRHARDTLAAMVGPIEEEAVMDRLFSTFCIGK